MLIVALIAFVILYSLAAWPFILDNSMQGTAYVISSQKIMYGQVPSPMNLFLSSNESYSMYLLKQTGTSEIYAVISSQPGQISGLVYLNSQTEEWYIQPNAAPIPVSGQLYDRIVIGTLVTVSQGTFSNGEYWITHTSLGSLLLQFSTLVVYVGPVILLAVIGISLRRFALWSFFVALWVYDLVFLIPGILGSKFGLQMSETFAALAIALPILAFVVIKLESSVRHRLTMR